MGIRTARNRPAAGDSASTTLGKKGPAGKGCCRRQAQCVCLIDRFTRHPASQKRRLQHSLDELHATCAGCYRCCRKDGHGSATGECTGIAGGAGANDKYVPPISFSGKTCHKGGGKWRNVFIDANGLGLLAAVSGCEPRLHCRLCF